MRFFFCFLLSVAGFASEAAPRRPLKAPKALQGGAPPESGPPESAPIRFPFALTPDRVREIFSDPEAIAQYRGREGCLLFALKSPNNITSMAYIYNMVSGALGPDRFKFLGRQAFKGKTEDFRSLRDKILDSEGNVRKEYRGRDGQALFADRHYNGDMFRTYGNVSAVLGGKDAVKEFGLEEWKSFQGSSDQYRQLVRLFRETAASYASVAGAGLSEGTPFYGDEGQKTIAEMFFKGNKRKAYKNISMIRETLFGCREAFKALKRPDDSSCFSPDFDA